MTREKIELLQEEVTNLQLAATHLEYSVKRCSNLIGLNGLPPEQLERLESLTSHFTRLADLLIQRIYRAEKRGWVNASEMIKIRVPRNLIAHEYTNEKMTEIYSAVAAMSPVLLAVVPNVVAYSNNIIQ